MAGQIFPALEECSIIFPRNTDAILSVYMPSCSILKFVSNNLGALEQFRIPHLDRLETRCGQWRTWRGNLQLPALHRIFAAQGLTYLHLDIKCDERLLTYMLGLAPALEELRMGLSSPRVLSSAFFLALAAGRRNPNTGPPSQTIIPLCVNLRVLHLHYKRWSRGTERSALIPAFGAIMATHSPEEQDFLFRLRVGEGTESQEWNVHEPAERFDVELESDRTFIGVSSPHGIVPLSSTLIISEDGHDVPSLLTEVEYITTNDQLAFPIDYLLAHHYLKEVRVFHSFLESGPNTPLSPNAPLFRTLKVLAVSSAPPSFMAGQTFHKLERYQEECNDCKDSSGQDTLAEMPLCTRLVAPLSRLATLKLPQICELGVFVDHEEPNYIWEQHFAVNANLSGLKLLHVCAGNNLTSYIIDITKIIRSLSALETLVLDSVHLGVPFVTFFETFIPMNAQGLSGLNQSSWGSQLSGVLCPRLESLQIEGIWLTEQPELMPVLEEIVTLRAFNGSPLKSFTFYFSWRPEKKWELIGGDGSFITEEVIPALKFRLDI